MTRKSYLCWWQAVVFLSMGASLALHGGDIGDREMEEPRDAQTQNRLQSMVNVSTQRGSQQSSTRQQLLWLVICQDARRREKGVDDARQPWGQPENARRADVRRRPVRSLTSRDPRPGNQKRVWGEGKSRLVRN